MALVSFGNGISAMSGKLAGNVYSRTKAGPTVRNWAKPTSTPTQKQNDLRVLFSHSNAMWQSLTDAQREGWSALASSTPEPNRLGLPQILSGIALFQRIGANVQNGNRGGGETPMIMQPPADLLQPDPVGIYSFEADGSANTIIITSTEELIPADVNYIIEATPQLPVTRNNFRRNFRWIATAESGDSWSLRDVGAAWTANFGDIVAGGKIALRVRAMFLYNGVTSAENVQTTIVIA
jgi:hypothetical protein